jgi:hypothetical protein
METLNQAWGDTASVEAAAAEMKAKARANAEAAKSAPKKAKPAQAQEAPAAEPIKPKRGRRPASKTAPTPHSTVLESIDRELADHARAIKKLLRAKKSLGAA